MKNLLRLFAGMAVVAVMFAGCESGSEGPPEPPDVISVYGVDIVEPYVAVEIGGTATLTAKVDPTYATNTAVRWSTSDASVAAVDAATGVITGVGAGSAVITVRTEDKGYTAQAAVLVKPEADPTDVLTMIVDPAFREYCEQVFVQPSWDGSSYDKNDDGKLSPAEAAAVEFINFYFLPEEDQYDTAYTLEGIEHFSGITRLYCNDLALTKLDLSKNTLLEWLQCNRNRLTELDLSNNTLLTTLECTQNLLTTLDLSKNTRLKELWCGNNPLDALDVTHNTALEVLHCWGQSFDSSDQFNIGRLKTLDVSKNTELTVLDCPSNRIEVLDVSKNTKLRELICTANQLRALDVSANTALTHLSCGGYGMSWYPQFAFMSELDLSANTALTHLNCAGQAIEALDISMLTALEELYCGANFYTSIDISRNRVLKLFDCRNSPGSGGVFTVTAWFDTAGAPANFTVGQWDYYGPDGPPAQTISVLYQKAS